MGAKVENVEVPPSLASRECEVPLGLWPVCC